MLLSLSPLLLGLLLNSLLFLSLSLSMPLSLCPLLLTLLLKSSPLKSLLLLRLLSLSLLLKSLLLLRPLSLSPLPCRDCLHHRRPCRLARIPHPDARERLRNQDAARLAS